MERFFSSIILVSLISLYSRVRNKRTPTFINFWHLFQGQRSYYGLKRLKVYYISFYILRGYHCFFCQIFQWLRLFKGLRLFQGTLHKNTSHKKLSVIISRIVFNGYLMGQELLGKLKMTCLESLLEDKISMLCNYIPYLFHYKPQFADFIKANFLNLKSSFLKFCPYENLVFKSNS